MKHFIMLLIVVLIGTSLFGQTPVPTDQELLDWFSLLPVQQKIAELRKLDNLERAIPSFAFPDYGAVLKDNGDLIVFPLAESQEGKIEVKIDFLHYKVTAPVYMFEAFYEEQKSSWERYVFFPLVCGAAGCLGTVISGDSNVSHYLISTGIGLAAGLLAAIFLN